MAKMFRHFSGCEEAFPFPYGCFCGPNLRETNSTLESVDAFDEACKVHDLCYDQLADDPKHHCHYLKDGYFGHYHWDISQGKAEVSEDMLNYRTERVTVSKHSVMFLSFPRLN